MSKTFFFYDLETSGLNPREDRIMQFAGIRTDMNFKQIGESYNILVKLNDDVLPSVEALLVTSITPQQTQADGYTEAEFAKLLNEEIFTPDTITVGFNNIRFDDEFVRYLFWRNFYDPYEWAWKEGRSRWDLLDVVRMTRALRPEGIEWPFNDKGEPVNKLELLSKVNGLEHTKAHDALSDVEALISVTKLIRDKQPQLYEYLLKLRDKNEIKKLINLDTKQPFVYVSGRLDSAFNKATVSFPLTSGRNGNVVVYDLRIDPTPFLKMSVAEIEDGLAYRPKDDTQIKLPLKELQYNRAPAVAPLGVLTQSDGWSKIGLDEATVSKHQNILLSSPTFAENVRSVFEKIKDYEPNIDSESMLYDSFVPDVDKIRIESVRNATEKGLADYNPVFVDERLPSLLLHYKARNFPKSLAESESIAWEEWRSQRLQKALPGYIKNFQKVTATISDSDKQYILQEIQLWLESIIPSED